MNGTDWLWLSFLRSNTEAMSDFLEYCTVEGERLLSDMRRAVASSDLAKAQQLEGQINLLDNLKKLSTIQDKEKRDYEEYKILRGH